MIRSSSPFTRRDFLRLGAAGVAVAQGASLAPAASADDPVLARAIASLGSRCLTPHAEFNTVERGNPLPYTLPLEKRREVGLERDTWKLEVFADPQSNSLVKTLPHRRGVVVLCAMNDFEFHASETG